MCERSRKLKSRVDLLPEKVRETLRPDQQGRSTSRGMMNVLLGGLHCRLDVGLHADWSIHEHVDSDFEKHLVGIGEDKGTISFTGGLMTSRLTAESRCQEVDFTMKIGRIGISPASTKQIKRGGTGYSCGEQV